MAGAPWQALVAALCVATVLFAGCAGDAGTGGDGSGEPTDGTTADGDMGAGGGAAGAGNVTEAGPGPEEQVSLYFTPDGFSWQPPPAGSVSVGSPSTAPVQGLAPDAFELTPLALPALIGAEGAVARLHLVAPYGQPTNGQYDVAVWFGATDRYNLFGATTGEPYVAPGAVQSFDLELGIAGSSDLFIPAGASPSALFAAQFGEEANGIELLVGGDDPSRIDFTMRNYTSDPIEAVTTSAATFEGQLVHPVAFTPCGGAEGLNFVRHAYEVPPGAGWLSFKLEITQKVAPHVDVDLAVWAGSTQLILAATPLGEEGILFADATLAPLLGQTLEVVVASCGTGPANYLVTVEQGT